jgi:hypothetical protein
MAEVLPFPFASLAELKERWPDFPVGAEAHATVLLEDASQFILDTVSTAGLASASTRRRIVCSVVRRAIPSQDGMDGMESIQESTGPFSQTFKPVNPSGDFYLTKSEKQALGFGAQRAFGVQIADVSTIIHAPWCSLNFGATYCSCGADIAGAPIYGAP